MRPHAVSSVGGTTFGYNGNGEMTSKTEGGTTTTYAWSQLHTLTSATQGANVTSFIYDGDGNRLLRKEPGGVATLYLSDGMELRLASSVVTGSRYYSLEGETVALRKGSALYWLADNHQDTQAVSVSSTGTVTLQRYMPFGASRGPANQLPGDRGFLDQVEDDGTGLVYLNARYYHAGIGRFISPDPLGSPRDPQSLNPYTYALNSPVGYSDPSGLCAVHAEAQYMCFGHSSAWGITLSGIAGNIQHGWMPLGGLPKVPSFTAMDFYGVIGNAAWEFSGGAGLVEAAKSGNPAAIALGVADFGSNFVPLGKVAKLTGIVPGLHFAAHTAAKGPPSDEVAMRLHRALARGMETFR